MNKKTLVLTLAVVVLLCAMGAVWFFLSPATTQGAKTVTVEVIHMDGTETSHTLHTDALYLADALLEAGLAEGEENTYGLFLHTVDGEFADEAKQQWWVYTVNGENAVYSADKQPITDGDQVEFSVYEG